MNNIELRKDHSYLIKSTFMKYVVLILVCCTLTLSNLKSQQNVGINDDGSAPDPKAILDVKSSTKGFLLPRMKTAQSLAIGNAP